MRLPLHDAQILTVICNPLEDFMEITFSITADCCCLARLLITGIRSIKTISDQDLSLFFAEGGSVDEASLTKRENGFVLELSGIMNDPGKYEQINWQFTIQADSIVYEEKPADENADDEYLKDFSVGGKNIPKIGAWTRPDAK